MTVLCTDNSWLSTVVPMLLNGRGQRIRVVPINDLVFTFGIVCSHFTIGISSLDEDRESFFQVAKGLSLPVFIMTNRPISKIDMLKARHLAIAGFLIDPKARLEAHDQSMVGSLWPSSLIGPISNDAADETVMIGPDGTYFNIAERWVTRLGANVLLSN